MHSWCTCTVVKGARRRRGRKRLQPPPRAQDHMQTMLAQPLTSPSAPRGEGLAVLQEPVEGDTSQPTHRPNKALAGLPPDPLSAAHTA